MKQTKLYIIICLTAWLVGMIIGAVFYYQQNHQANERDLNYFFVDQEIIDSINAGADKCLNDNKNEFITGGIVNHHLLAGGLIKDFFCRVGNQEIKRVILLSPNHFGLGNGSVIAGKRDWRTSNGILPADQAGVSSLKNSESVNIDDGVFIKEHGIGNLIPAVKAYFPRAEIIPIIVKEKISTSSREKIIFGIDEISDNNSIIIASLDFSHNLPLAEAEIKDAQTIKILAGLDYGRINELNLSSEASNVDSSAVLDIFLRLMSNQRAEKFDMLDHSNSAIISGQAELASTTSYFTAVYSK